MISILRQFIRQSESIIVLREFSIFLIIQTICIHNFSQFIRDQQLNTLNFSILPEKKAYISLVYI